MNKYRWSGVLLITDDNKLISMHRDNNPDISEPNSYGIFGGAAEGNESPLVAAMREINEETNINPRMEDFEFFKSYVQDRDYLDQPAEISVFILRNINPAELVTYEGQGIKILENAEDSRIATDIKEIFVDWFDSI